MAKTKNAPPIGFGRIPFDDLDDATDEGAKHQPEEKPLEPPLAEPIFVDNAVMYELFKRYNLWPLTPLSPFELQLVQVIGGLEKRVRELDPDL
ncbi:hypothetical protein [Hymenobacter rubidus]|uniref:hypothetical protein n=1 Tax=Hymenobacter rubidus TaxID=1441626 RepID=UPI00191DC886|nr:hypothetical protein [Hymenobacter rubidus]